LSSDLRLLAISAQITEVLYSISDIQTRIFGNLLPCYNKIYTNKSSIEIQELRHQAVEVSEIATELETSTPDGSVSAIDQALMDLDAKLEVASKSIEELDNSVNNLHLPSMDPSEEKTFVAAKRDHVMQEWEGVQKESEELRKELSDDKWLVVFRSVTEQADNMMSSLEKILTQCQVSMLLSSFSQQIF
jgi:hypothetical protein